MAVKEEKSNKKESTKLNLKIQNPKEKATKNQENKKTLTGNKRERTKESQDEEEQEQNQEKKNINCSFKICNYCKNINAIEILEFDETTQNQTIIDYISKIIKDSNFIKIIKDNIEYILKNKDNNKLKNKIIICSQCFLNIFIAGGLEKIFFEKRDDKDESSNIQNKYLDLNENDQKKNLKQIVDIYSINLNLAIKSIKDLKSKYSKVIKSANDIFKNTAIRMMLSNFRENFQGLKKKIDDCEENFKEIEDIFDNIINDLTQKEEMKKFCIEGVFSNDNISKNNLLKILKKVENEIEIGTINISNGPKPINNENDKTPEASEVIVNNKENNDNKNNSNNKNNITNNINNNTLLNIQNPKKPNINEQLLLNNNIDKAEILKNNMLLNQNNYNPTGTNSDFFLNPGLGFFPNIPPQGGRIPSNILINNLFPSPNLNPQLISQINSSQINSIFPNNNNNTNINNSNNSNNNTNSNPISNPSNETNKSVNNNLNNINNLNGLNNIPYPGFLPRGNFPFNNPNEPFKDFDNIFSMRNLMNTNQNNIINNLYNSQINPNSISLSPLPFNNFPTNPPSMLSPNLGTNFIPSNPSLFNNILNLQGNNNISNLSQPINTNNTINNNLEQNKLTHLNIINREKNLMNTNQNNNNKGTNVNNNISNLGNANIKNNINNINNVNNISNLTGLSNLSININNLNRNEMASNINGQEKLLDLFNNLAKNKESKNASNENIYNLKNNNNINNNNAQIELNINNEQNILPLDYSDIRPAPINNIENSNNNINNSEPNVVIVNNNNSLIPNNINNINNNNSETKNNNEINNEKEKVVKDNHN